ncbi:exodeoxyribonuclease VII large subunit [Virgibacillus alimentarius]|uniref:Exodeoxyribonuclease 7 large subunit n=1 Tax=Virgibacillus alimentarius TaxID=698769 RepID=A0ABS4S4P7_9BACI|nr:MULTISPECIES: exodeoxyribonuclease VII large subunit [Virgibacillus]MBP2256469.1 exodeoxyribonuclease VII large subunit [Virgibacillus alimentarius]HLR66414.1 exodeoxyribonuclease VII large subunit [Virgibacillus sp.]
MKDNYLTVTALTKYIKRKIDTDVHLRNIWLKGEISNFKLHSRGHMYLTIKDDQTRIQAVMFAGKNRFLKFKPEDGMNVLIRGEISVFEPFGQYQIYIQQMEPDGIGALAIAFEQLKEKLQKQGYFDKNIKKPIPMFPKHIGIITSPTGAAVRDVISTLKRRFPIIKHTIIPVLVQGQHSAMSIKKAIELANDKNLFDVLIIGRGGGSIEELWSFNEEIVADAIFHSKIPIISAVGHETDVTISDYVADLRAPTPTGAAELAVPSHIEIKEKISNMKQSAISTMSNIIKNREQHLKRIGQSYAFRYPEQLLKQKEQELDKQIDRLEKFRTLYTNRKHERLMNANIRLINQHPKKQIKQGTKELKQLVKQKNNYMLQIFEKNSKNLATVIEKLTLLNPLEVMKRGFAIPYTIDGHIINSSHQVQMNDKMKIKLSDGLVKCNVTSVEGDNDGYHE